MLVRNSQAEKKDFKKYLKDLDEAVSKLDSPGGEAGGNPVPEAVRRRRERKKKKASEASDHGQPV